GGSARTVGADQGVAWRARPGRAPVDRCRNGCVSVTHPERSRRVTKLRRLKAGDRVALVAPASSFPPEEVRGGVAELARLGLEAVYDDSLFEKDRFVAGSVETRVAAIRRAWE